jgi:hypothetical protein
MAVEGWNGGNGAALGLGFGLGLLVGALATAPYYAAPYYAAPGYGYAPAPTALTTWYWCDPYQQYYPYVASCPTAWRGSPVKPGWASACFRRR